MEPYLSDPREMIKELEPFVTHCIWLGKMNHCKELEFDEEQYQKIAKFYEEDFIRELIDEFQDNEKVYYKYSMMRAIGLKGKRTLKN